MVFHRDCILLTYPLIILTLNFLLCLLTLTCKSNGRIHAGDMFPLRSYNRKLFVMYLPDTGHSAVLSPDAYSSKNRCQNHKDSHQESFPEDCTHKLYEDKSHKPSESQAAAAESKVGVRHPRDSQTFSQRTYIYNQGDLRHLGHKSLLCKHHNVLLPHVTYTDTDQQ